MEEGEVGLPLAYAPTRDWAHNPGMCPDRESNFPGDLSLCGVTLNRATPVRAVVVIFKRRF